MADIPLLVHAGRLVAAHDSPVVFDAGVVISGGTILEIGSFRELAAQYPSVKRVGGPEVLLIPGLVNSHGHGRGLSTFQRGSADDSLEAWIWDTRKGPALPIYDDTAYSACRLLKSGVTATMHNHLPSNPAAGQNEYHQALDAYRDTGLRVLFCPGVRNVRPLVYGDNHSFLRSLPSDLQRYWSPVLAAPAPSAEAYVRSVEELAAGRSSDAARIGFGPLAPQWCSLDLLQCIMTASREMGAMVHMHLAETLLQKVFALAEWGCSMVEFLAGHDLLGPELVLAHGVWLTEKDIRLLAASGAGLTHQPSSNLRLKAGIAPVGAMIDAGLKVGIGLDGMAINDDDDMIQEMKICYRLHRLHKLEVGGTAIPARKIFEMATETGARLIGYGSELGRLEAGRKADMVLFDYERMCHPYTAPDADPIDTLMYRGSKGHIESVIVDGKELVRNGRIGAVDEDEIGARLAEAASPEKNAGRNEIVRMTEALKTHLARYYRGWTESVSARPYYLPNSKTANRRSKQRSVF